MSDILDCYTDYLRASGAAVRTVTARLEGARRLLAVAGSDDPARVRLEHALHYVASVPAATSRATYYQHVMAFARFLDAVGYPAEFARHLPAARFPRGLPRPIDVNELSAALAVASRRPRMMLLLAAFAGLRVSEIAMVHGEDVNGNVYVRHGKGGQVGMVPTHPTIEVAARDFPASGPWFANKDGVPMSRVSVWRHMTDVLRTVGSSATPHQVRHYYGCALLDSGANARTVQTLLRHANLSSTQVYTRVTDVARRRAIEALPDIA